MYLRGKGVPKDSQKALEWFTKAAAGGDELAKKNVKTLQILSSRN
jgi:TPR repeat protein